MKIKSNGGSNYDNCVLLKAQGKKKEQFVDLKCKFYAVDFRLKLTRNFLEKFDHKSR